MEFHPVDAFANRIRGIGQAWRNHPFQQLASLGAGALGGPLAARAAQFGFNRFNDNQFNNAASAIAERTRQQGDQAGQAGFDRPLNGPLGGFEGAGRGGDNSALTQALMGGGRYGGTADAAGGAYNMAQNWQAGHQSPSVASMLALPGGQGVPQTPNGSFFTDPQYDPANQQGSGKLRDSRENDSRAYMTPLMQGVTNFSVGGFPVINGSRGYGAFGGSGQGYFQGRKPGR